MVEQSSSGGGGSSKEDVTAGARVDGRRGFMVHHSLGSIHL